MNETQRLETLLGAGNGGSVRLPRRDAQELAQKLKVRGNPGAAARLVELLNSPGDVDLDVRHPVQRLVQEGDALVEGEHRLLVLRVPDDADHEAVEDARGALDHVDVAVGDRVEGAWIDGCDHGCSKREIRAEP